MMISEILHTKGSNVHTIDERAKVTEAIERLIHHNVGSLLVCDMYGHGGASVPVGIVSERDILRAMSFDSEEMPQLLVGDIMTTGLILVTPRDTVRRAMELMTAHRVRHLPVMEGRSLAGLVSIGDLVKAQCADLQAENECLHRYLEGESATLAASVSVESVQELRKSRDWLWLS